jgi:UPF0042 nucleotide-binding protein
MKNSFKVTGKSVPVADQRGRSEGADLHVCIVTGLSGAGKSTALQVFEDLNYFTVDGLPANLTLEIVNMVKLDLKPYFKGVALGIDMRQGDFFERLKEALPKLVERGIRPLLIFLESQTSELIRRYATTRRPHPLERKGLGLEAALAREREDLAALREAADMIIDTTKLSVHDLRRDIQKKWSDKQGKAHAIRVNVISFGFKYGVPREADMVLDLRFLPNPYFVEELRPLCGRDKVVSDYVFATENSIAFRKKLLDLLCLMLSMMETEGRYRVAVALGCTGGRHRSVSVAEEVARELRKADYPVSLEHRHLELG